MGLIGASRLTHSLRVQPPNKTLTLREDTKQLACLICNKCLLTHHLSIPFSDLLRGLGRWQVASVRQSVQMSLCNLAQYPSQYSINISQSLVFALLSVTLKALLEFCGAQPQVAPSISGWPTRVALSCLPAHFL